MHRDQWNRIWDISEKEACPVCGQPDNCGDCNHGKLTPDDLIYQDTCISDEE